MTAAQRRWRGLLVLWVLAFGGGALVTTAAVGIPAASGISSRESFLPYVWLGQVTLFLASLGLLRGIEPRAPLVVLICSYKLVAGLTMLFLSLEDFRPSVGRVVAGGGIFDLLMGALTLIGWLPVRAEGPPCGTGGVETPEGAGGESGTRYLGRVLRAGATGFALLASWVFVEYVLLLPPPGVFGMIACANACAVFAGLAAACRNQASPSRLGPPLPPLVVASGVGGLGLLLWLWRFPPEAAQRRLGFSSAASLLLFAFSSLAVSPGAAQRHGLR